MAAKATPSRRPHPQPQQTKTGGDFSVRSEEMLEVSLSESDAWTTFLRWCVTVPTGTKVELLRNNKVTAWLNASGTPRVRGVLSLHGTAHVA